MSCFFAFQPWFQENSSDTFWKQPWFQGNLNFSLVNNIQNVSLVGSEEGVNVIFLDDSLEQWGMLIHFK